jgi:hypothetical protein
MANETRTSSQEPVVFFDRILDLPSNQDRTLIGFPRDQSVADFELFTGSDLNILVNRAVKYYYNELKLVPSEVRYGSRYDL